MTEQIYMHNMLREIVEQPEALRRTLAFFTTSHNGRLALCEEVFAPAFVALAQRDSLVIAGSGSSRHAGLIGEALFESIAGLPVDVEYASEYIYSDPQTVGNAAFFVLSQSGETADTLQALRRAQEQGLPTIAITNNQNSTMACLADCSLTTQAGIERAVPATKSFTSQLLLLNLLSLFAARLRGRLPESEVQHRLHEIGTLPGLLQRLLPVWETQLKSIVNTFGHVTEYLFLGRGLQFPVALEAALKLKESAYSHAEAYPTGELKHGPNAVISESSVIFVLATNDDTSVQSKLRYAKTLNLVRDLKLQGARLFGIVTEGDTLLQTLCEEVIVVSSCAEALSPILEIVPLQLLAYFTAVSAGVDPDSPRNLAKAVLRE